jgi:predicted nucleic acid-binding protein
MSVTIDANVLVYAMDRTDAARRGRALSVINRFVRSKDAVLAEQTLWEFHNVVVRRQLVSRTRALALVEASAQQVQVAHPAAPAVAETLALLRATNLHVWDARLLATCGACGIRTLLSEDMQDGALYGSVRVLNPFNPANDKIIAELLK